ncbi:MAG: TDE2712 family protein [Senegalia sp. (in: firmicutes)]
MAKIAIKNHILEMMLYMWDSISQREKIGEIFILKLADEEDMQYLYGEDFDKESVRKVLSAISNRELLNKPTKKESRFWNKNMWMMEDMDFTNSMVAPVKTLNLDDVKDKLKEDEYEVVFIPGHMDDYYIDGNKLIINFFKVMVNPYNDEPAKIDDKPLKEYIEEKLLTM